MTSVKKKIIAAGVVTTAACMGAIGLDSMGVNVVEIAKEGINTGANLVRSLSQTPKGIAVLGSMPIVATGIVASCIDCYKRWRETRMTKAPKPETVEAPAKMPVDSTASVPTPVIGLPEPAGM